MVFDSSLESTPVLTTVALGPTTKDPAHPQHPNRQMAVPWQLVQCSCWNVFAWLGAVVSSISSSWCNWQVVRPHLQHTQLYISFSWQNQPAKYSQNMPSINDMSNASIMADGIVNRATSIQTMQKDNHRRILCIRRRKTLGKLVCESCPNICWMNGLTGGTKPNERPVCVSMASFRVGVAYTVRRIARIFISFSNWTGRR